MRWSAGAASARTVDWRRGLVASSTMRSSAVNAAANRCHTESEGSSPKLRAKSQNSAAVVVPLRSGSGTRIKVLEAFAHRLPVATTTIGCEGLDVHDDHEVLIGDTPQALATACVRLLSDSGLAREIADAGHGLWEQRYQWPGIRGQIRDLVHGLER